MARTDRQCRSPRPRSQNGLMTENGVYKMFEDSLLERRFSKTRRRGVATIVSFGFEFLLIGLLILIPLWYTEALPTHELVTFLVAPAPPPPPPPPPAEAPPVQRVRKSVVSEISDAGKLRTPTRIPQKIQMIKEEAPPMVASTGGVVGGVPGGIPGGQIGGVIGGIITSTAATHVPKALPPKPIAPKRVRVSQGVTEGLLVHKVTPFYPALARQARIHGSVVLSAVIGKDGTIQNLQVQKGHPMLAPAAVSAVSQWQYRPYMLNGQPVEVETQITVNFTLAG
jgi:periplasmic protein TonB